MNKGDFLVAHTTVELSDGTEVSASWFFRPGSKPNHSLDNPDPGSAPELSYVEVDGMMFPGESDCKYRLQQNIGVTAYYQAEDHAAEVAERSGPDPDERREEVGREQ